jgi:hypothetical protein
MWQVRVTIKFKNCEISIKIPPYRLNEKQKRIKISNILSELKKENKIINTGTDTKSCWKSVI